MSYLIAGVLVLGIAFGGAALVCVLSFFASRPRARKPMRNVWLAPIAQIKESEEENPVIDSASIADALRKAISDREREKRAGRPVY